jgi:hypothetical protein
MLDVMSETTLSLKLRPCTLNVIEEGAGTVFKAAKCKGDWEIRGKEEPGRTFLRVPKEPGDTKRTG